MADAVGARPRPRWNVRRVQQPRRRRTHLLFVFGAGFTKHVILLKKFILWSYGRETSVYVIFCLLIVAFIFLTPKSWFDNREPVATQTSRVIVQQKDLANDRGGLEKRVRELSGRPDAVIIGMRERKSDSGEIVYEIDIR